MVNRQFVAESLQFYSNLVLHLLQLILTVLDYTKKTCSRLKELQKSLKFITMILCNMMINLIEQKCRHFINNNFHFFYNFCSHCNNGCYERIKIFTALPVPTCCNVTKEKFSISIFMENISRTFSNRSRVVVVYIKSLMLAKDKKFFSSIDLLFNNRQDILITIIAEKLHILQLTKFHLSC